MARIPAPPVSTSVPSMSKSTSDFVMRESGKLEIFCGWLGTGLRLRLRA